MATHRAGRHRTTSGEPGPDPAVLDVVLHTELGEVWRRGWAPADVMQVAARRLPTDQRGLMAHLLVIDGRRRSTRGQALHPRWSEQLGALVERHGEPGDELVSAEPTALAGALAVLALLHALPSIPVTIPPPGSDVSAAIRGLDARMLERVRALLAKAESTEFEEEAEALTAKAQELITRHAVDEALLHAEDDIGVPSLRRIAVDDPYADAKALLLTEVGSANGCRVVYTSDFGWVTAFGYDSALDAVELLGASLLAQATAAMARHGARRDAYGRSRTRSFRRSFLLGFAARIGHRLRAATQAEVSAAGKQDRLLPVLSAQEERVDRAVAEAFPGAVSKRWSASHAGGWAAGQAAAELARLDLGGGALRNGGAA